MFQIPSQKWPRIISIPNMAQSLWSYYLLVLKWLIGKNEVLFVVHELQNFDSLQTCIKSVDQKNSELHN